MFRLYIAILRCGYVDYCTAIVLKIINKEETQRPENRIHYHTTHTTAATKRRFPIWEDSSYGIVFKIDIGEPPKDINKKDCNTPILYFNYALYIDCKKNCSAIVNVAAPEDGDV
jgi:hypothetical protein